MSVLISVNSFTSLFASLELGALRLSKFTGFVLPMREKMPIVLHQYRKQANESSIVANNFRANICNFHTVKK